VSENLNSTFRRRNEAEYDFQSRALAGSIRPKQTIDLAGGNLQIQLMHCDDGAPPQRSGKNLGNAGNSDSGISHAEFQSRGVGVDLQPVLRTAS